MNEYQEALAKLKQAIDMLYSLSKFYWDIGYGIIGKEPKPIISEEEIKLFTDLIDKEIPKKPNYRTLSGDILCENCYADLGNMYTEFKKTKRCDECGQVLDWTID